jgi:hypothetical protein
LKLKFKQLEKEFADKKQRMTTPVNLPKLRIYRGITIFFEYYGAEIDLTVKGFKD